VWQFIDDRRDQIAYNTFQHANLVVQAVIVATLIAIVLAVVVVWVPRLEPVANTVSAIGLTIPSFALVGLLLPLLGIGALTAFWAVAFYAVFPVLRNAVVGLRGVDATLLESARGMGMNPVAVLLRVRLPLAWPVILAGVRVSRRSRRTSSARDWAATSSPASRRSAARTPSTTPLSGPSAW
jgi:osmoprotectant transport system permease protein